LFERAGWLIRIDSQFHWHNRDYASFDDFLADLSSPKRKAIRKERARAWQGLEVVHLSGADIQEAHWDAFGTFYQIPGAASGAAPTSPRASSRWRGSGWRTASC
jgi:predicted N-acyltransferase